MRIRIDGLIGSRSNSFGPTHATWTDSALVAIWPPTGFALKAIENCCRTSPSLYSIR